jgi:Glycosyl hydrolases family 43
MARRHSGRPVLRSGALLVAVVVVALGVLPATIAQAAGPPQDDVIPYNGTGAPSDHGWFQAGHQWIGDFGDPDIVTVGNTYYAYASPVGGRELPVLTSTNLTTWTIRQNYSTSGHQPGDPGYDVLADTSIPFAIRSMSDPNDPLHVNVFNNNDALVTVASWGLEDPQGAWIHKDYWAAGVGQIGSSWYAYNAVKVSNVFGDPYGRFCLTVAKAKSPLGPFRDVSGTAPIQCEPASREPTGSIDPFPYHDPISGNYYLLWKAAGVVGGIPSAIKSVQLDPATGLPIPHAPHTILLTTNYAAAWEGSTIENPSMVYYEGRTYLFYSANNSAADASGNSNYATGYAICSGPQGPCTRPTPQTPLLASLGAFDPSQQGPGGSDGFLDAAGNLHVAYATYWLDETPRPDGLRPRRLHIATLHANAHGVLKVTVRG